MKLNYNLKHSQSQQHKQILLEEVILFVTDTNGSRWGFEGNARISELISNDIWSFKAVSED